ncbi:arginine--tRNA ligase [Beduini massiliensis]|uniref:arginine--tRNA ligase n=1 Tax=Beduini massiliensis TaxID=1585974 RepID=UPI00059AB4BD|nr:arginine--tRNA ligase [Beduini massiliensis]
MAINKIETALKQLLAESVIKSGLLDTIEADNIVIEIPRDTTHGDYSSNIAMQLTKKLKRNPREIAQAIVNSLETNKDLITKVEIAGPGFINLFVHKASMTSIIGEVISEGDQYGRTDFGKGIKYDVEFVSANPTGDLHLGHAKGAAVGDSICRILDAAGYEVTREYYINDAGNQINNLAASLFARYLQAFGKEVDLPEDGYHGKDIIDIAEKMKEEFGDRFVNSDYEEVRQQFRDIGVKYELQKIKDILQEFRVSYDVWYPETRLYEEERIQPALDKLNEKGYTYKEEGALWLRSTAFGDDKDRVLIKSDGSYTYLTPDIAYHLDKFNRGYDYLVDLLGADHHGYIARMKAAVQALGYNADQLEIDIIQMVRMIQDGQEVKMSKRTGNAVTIRDLVEEIGVDATRYFFVCKAASSRFDFDLDLAKSQSNDNPVFYAQYAHARMCSIMAQAKKLHIDKASQYDLIVEEKEIELVKHINEFRNEIIDSAKNRTPHKIANYIQKLAQLFHSFYGECKVLDSENKALSAQRLALVEATKITLKNALNLIGVEAPDKM